MINTAVDMSVKAVEEIKTKLNYPNYRQCINVVDSGSNKLMKTWNFGKRLFYDKHKFGYPYTLIHPYKQLQVRELVDILRGKVDYIFIFGSSTQNWHMWWKDLDICLIGKQIHKFKFMYKYDLVNYQDLEELYDLSYFGDIKSSIIESGVMIYEKI